jgi:hypothetical protein
VTADVALPHGYTLDQVDHLAKAAVNLAGTYASDYADRYDAAHYAILVALYTAPHWLPREKLISVGARAVSKLVNQALHLRGYRDAYSGAGSSPRWRTYWFGLPAVTHGPEDRVVEHVAATQILAHLRAVDQRALTALAATRDYQKAADLIGVSYPTLSAAITRARRRALALWHEGEAPSRVWRKDVHFGSRTAVRPAACPKGHPYDEANTGIRRSGAIWCRRCGREREAARRAGRRLADAVGTGKTGCAP